MKKPFSRMTAASIVGATLLFGSLATLPAMADGLDGIDANQTTKLTIHKYENPAWGDQYKADGSALTAPNTAVALNGVTFKVYKVLKANGDAASVTSADDWASATTTEGKLNLSVTQDGKFTGPDGWKLDSGTDKTTATDGSIEAASAQGFYCVVEQDSTNVTRTDNTAVTVTKKAEPFCLSLPYAQTSGWLYDVNVYPKNQVVTEAAKTAVLPASAKQGDVIKWNVTLPVPSGAVSAFGFDDTLDTALTFSKVSDVKVDSTALADDDYKATTEGQKVSFRLSESGLKKLENVKNLTLVLETTIAEAGKETAKIANQNALAPVVNDKTLNAIAGDAVFRGAIKVTKVAKGTQNGLQGAQFKLWKTAADTCEADAPEGVTPLTATTDNTGVLTFDGLPIGTALDDQTSTSYCLLETKAPAGYQKVATATKITLNESDTTYTTEQKIENTAVSALPLPVTGSTGIVLFSMIGLVLAAGGFGLYRASRRA